MTRFGKYFYGNEISKYGQANGFVDYRTFAKAFDAVMSNDIIAKTWETFGEWEQESGWIDNSAEIEEIREKIEALEYDITGYEEIIEETEEEERAGFYGEIEAAKRGIAELEEKIEELEYEQEEQPEIFQYFIIDENGARICKEFDEIVFYNSELDMYVWGVTHWGTSWDYVLTNIPCDKA